ncbi:DUF4352 domain-containing protein [Nocardiopsis mangrovi]|uniref:DUF4352 domain-containing protein n=1 Tax=Nocardiopsis mangrovi TaxID=1179818 RepID=A0ABV9DX11_9ACTN
MGVGCVAVIGSNVDAPPEPGGSGEQAADDSAEPAAEEDTDGGDALIPLGEPGTVDDWTVTVAGMETTSVYGDEFLEETAQGEFRVISLTVENTGSEATYFDSSAVKLVDANGSEYSSQTVLGGDDLFLEQINPGNSVSGEAVVDVPEGTEVAEVVVEDVWSFSDPLRFSAE